MVPVAPVAAEGIRPLDTFTPTQQQAMQQPNGSAAGRAFLPATNAAPAMPAQNPASARSEPTNPAPVYGLETMFRGPGPETLQVRPDAAQVIRVPGQGRSTNTGQPLAPARPAAPVMAFNAPGNPITAAAPQQSPIMPAPQVMTGAEAGNPIVQAAPAPQPAPTPVNSISTAPVRPVAPRRPVRPTSLTQIESSPLRTAEPVDFPSLISPGIRRPTARLA
jgi:hypothetical protein